MFTNKAKKESNKLKDNENIELIRKYRETGNEYYKEEFFIKNSKLPYHMAKSYKDANLSVDDMVSLANYGMLKAFNTFNLAKEVRFATYSIRCMHNEILMEFRRTKKHRNLVSLEESISLDNEGQSLTIMDKVESDTSNDIDKLDTADAIQAIVAQLTDELDEHGRFILFNMLNCENRLKQKEVGKILNLSQTYVSRVEKKITGKAKEIAIKLSLGNLTQFNSTYEKKKQLPMPQNEPKEIEADSPVITYTLKETKKMEKSKIVIPNGTMRSKVLYLMDNHPELSRGEMASLLGKNIATVYSYVSEIKKKREKEKAKNVDLETQAHEIFEKPSKVNQDEVVEFVSESAPLKPPTPTPAPEPQQIEQILLEKAPETLELSLTGINGAHLQKLLFELLNNSVSGDGKYSFIFSLERIK